MCSHKESKVKVNPVLNKLYLEQEKEKEGHCQSTKDQQTGW